MGASGMGGQWYGGPVLWGTLWLLKDPMLRRGSGCAAVTPGPGVLASLARDFGSCAVKDFCNRSVIVLYGSVIVL